MSNGRDNKGTRQRRSRDSSLYKDLYNKGSQEKEPDVGEEARSRGYRFVLSDDPEVVPVDHQALIESLTSSLAQIDDDQRKLEAELANNHRANKLEIAQIKGRLAALDRRKSEIEQLLISSRAAAEQDTQDS